MENPMSSLLIDGLDLPPKVGGKSAPTSDACAELRGGASRR